ncbi:hypothetical protein [Rossellomorea vietnamensis]|uniref:Uncharacterized protein n=1 Tax=Rossellomorea vietnamensis TaxID=218284 RepID=A0A0N8GH39_9BACI|nr:hypothetical protein [Rossellomorea vietnamensis]KPL60226.1 hypothetical protein AM506_06245 [Rossellomorea vietnamensis]
MNGKHKNGSCAYPHLTSGNRGDIRNGKIVTYNSKRARYLNEQYIRYFSIPFKKQLPHEVDAAVNPLIILILS